MAAFSAACTLWLLSCLSTLHFVASAHHYDVSILNLTYVQGPLAWDQDLTNNVGLAYFNGTLYASVRHVKLLMGNATWEGYPIKIWNNTNYVCTLAPEKQRFTPVKCQVYNPVRHTKSCHWNWSDWTIGIEDARLFTWPGKGLYTMFHAKPPGRGYCEHLMHMPYLALLKPFEPSRMRLSRDRPDATVAKDPWLLPRAVPLYFRHLDTRNPCFRQELELASREAATRVEAFTVAKRRYLARRRGGGPHPFGRNVDGATARRSSRRAHMHQPSSLSWKLEMTATTPANDVRRAHLDATDTVPYACTPHLQAILNAHRQKNWAPFVHNGTLYFSMHLNPHVVLKCTTRGRCRIRYVTDNFPLFNQANWYDIGSGPRGNTPTIFIPASLAPDGKPFYLGILHFIRMEEDVKQYTNVFFKMQPSPPFKIEHMSASIPLKIQVQGVNKQKWFAFPLGLEMNPLTKQLIVSYGSSDVTSHISLFHWEEILSLFARSVFDPNG